jgi:hypothetical protein
MSANGNGGTYHYYACTGRQKYGPADVFRRAYCARREVRTFGP